MKAIIYVDIFGVVANLTTFKDGLLSIDFVSITCCRVNEIEGDYREYKTAKKREE